MRSAYEVLGVPASATPDEIEGAFRAAERLFPRERLAKEDGARLRFDELRDAYKVLHDPETRAAHDRKLQEGTTPRPRPRAMVVEAETSPLSRMLVYGVLLAVIVLGVGAFHHWHDEQARRERAAQELAVQRAEAEAARRKREEEARRASLREQQTRDAEANERWLKIDSQRSDNRAQAEMRAQEPAQAEARPQAPSGQPEPAKRGEERLQNAHTSVGTGER